MTDHASTPADQEADIHPARGSGWPPTAEGGLQAPGTRTPPTTVWSLNMTSEQHEGRLSEADAAYQAPGIVRLGTLAELTQGGGVPSPDDGFRRGGRRWLALALACRN